MNLWNTIENKKKVKKVKNNFNLILYSYRNRFTKKSLKKKQNNEIKSFERRFHRMLCLFVQIKKFCHKKTKAFFKPLPRNMESNHNQKYKYNKRIVCFFLNLSSFFNIKIFFCSILVPFYLILFWYYFYFPLNYPKTSCLDFIY